MVLERYNHQVSTVAGRVASAVAAVRDEMTSVLVDLVRTPSVTGQEGPAQAIVADVLSGLGLDVDMWCPIRDELSGHPSFSDDELPLGTRPVVIGRWRVGSGPSVILNGHIDVVPVGDHAGWPHPPYAGVVEDGVLCGVGGRAT